MSRLLERLKLTVRYLLLSITCIGSLYANLDVLDKNEDATIVQVRNGNFALPSSQQPGPLIGFGQNIVDKGDLQLYTSVNYARGDDTKLVNVGPTLVYGIKDNLSLFCGIPFAPKLSSNNQSSQGIGDALVQLEYALYGENTLTTASQITLVSSVTLPTGSSSKIPPTGAGVPTFFLGLTASYSGIEWYAFASSGVMLTPSHKAEKDGNQFLYQCGLGRNIAYDSDKWIFNVMVELDGIYQQRNKVGGKTDRNSGGNALLLGPSLWFSTQQLIVQLGISGVISQHLFGVQDKDRYVIALDIGWKF